MAKLPVPIFLTVSMFILGCSDLSRSRDSTDETVTHDEVVAVDDAADDDDDPAAANGGGRVDVASHPDDIADVAEHAQAGAQDDEADTEDVPATSAPAPATTSTAAAAPQPLLRYGLHPRASDALRRAAVTAGQITQTIGNAKASAGTHAADGTFGGKPYSAAVDLRTSGMTATAIRSLLARLGQQGFAAWYRSPGHDGWPSSGAAHVHAVYAGCPMKRALRDQIHDWANGKNGLASHAHYYFYKPTDLQESKVRTLFFANNPING